MIQFETPELDALLVMVMTPTILPRSLRHNFNKMNMIKVLIMDEFHHAKGCDRYACTMTETRDKDNFL
ncbi:unnamed protein product [Lupinus luteus]|uniref:Helicase ATP-binding domain-containing protein n=1 Tax=Lupinus luteus TaxID=3873 RepID=A0AAV1X6W3_LUPLU